MPSNPPDIGAQAGQAAPGDVLPLGSWTLAAVFAALPGAALLLTPEFRIAAVSDSYLAATGTTRPQLVGQQLFDAFPGLPGTPEATTMADLRVSLQQVLATGQPHDMPGQHYRVAGLWPDAAPESYWQPRNAPVLDAQGRVQGLVHQVTNVTGQIAAQQQLQALNEELENRVATRTQEAQAAQAETERQRLRLEQLVLNAPIAICLFEGPQWVYELVNPSYQRLFPGRHLLGQRLVEALPEVAAQPLMDILQTVYETGVPYESKAVLVPLARTDDGPVEDIYFDLTYQASFDQAGHIAGFVTYAQDVTAQVLARQQLEAQRQRLLALFEQAPVGIAVFRGPRYVIELVNPAVCAMWGRTPQQALHTPLFELLPEAAGQGFEELLDGVMATGVPYVAHELPAIIEREGRRDTVYWNFVYQPLYEGSGPATAVTVIATEVTEQVLTRQQVQGLNEALQVSNTGLNETNQQLRRTNADLDNFIYTASHDLWAPISNIEGLLTALRLDLTLPPEEAAVPELLDLMQGAVERFKRTIRDLTDVARLQQAHAQPATPVHLAQLIEEVRLDMAPQLLAADARLEVQVGTHPVLHFSEKNLRSIIYNLLSNALKYRHPGRPPRVLVRCYPTPRFTVLAVQDNGLGLNPAQQEKVFGLFQRLHDHVEGSGIGLYMVKKIIENAGGGIEVESQVGVGSTFLVYFPR